MNRSVLGMASFYTNGKYVHHSEYRNVPILRRTQGTVNSKYIVSKKGGKNTLKAIKEKIDGFWNTYPDHMNKTYGRETKV